MIINNKQLDDDQKLFNKNASLKDEAKQLVPPDVDFNSLSLAVIKRHENKRLLIDLHILANLNYEKMQHESPKELHNFIYIIDKNIRALIVMEYLQKNLSDNIFINIIL